MYVIFIQYSILYFRMRGQAENVPELLMYTVLYQETWEVWTLSNNYDCGWVNVILCALNLIVHVLIVLNMLRYWSLKIDNPYRCFTVKYFNTYISIYILWLFVYLSYSKIFTMRRLTCFLDCCMFFTCFLIHLHLFPPGGNFYTLSAIGDGCGFFRPYFQNLSATQYKYILLNIYMCPGLNFLLLSTVTRIKRYEYKVNIRFAT